MLLLVGRSNAERSVTAGREWGREVWWGRVVVGGVNKNEQLICFNGFPRWGGVHSGVIVLVVCQPPVSNYQNKIQKGLVRDRAGVTLGGTFPLCIRKSHGGQFYLNCCSDVSG